MQSNNYHQNDPLTLPLDGTPFSGASLITLESLVKLPFSVLLLREAIPSRLLSLVENKANVSQRGQSRPGARPGFSTTPRWSELP